MPGQRLSIRLKTIMGAVNREGPGRAPLIEWTRLSCCSFAANAGRLQLHALAYNLAEFMRTPARPEAVAQWSLTSLRE